MIRLHVGPPPPRTKCGTCGKFFAHYVCNDPDRCQKCGEMLSRVTLGTTKCRCMESRPPRGRVESDRPSPQVRYGN